MDYFKNINFLLSCIGTHLVFSKLKSKHAVLFLVCLLKLLVVFLKVRVDSFNPTWSGSLAAGAIGMHSLEKLNLSATAVSLRLNSCVLVHGSLVYINGVKVSQWYFMLLTQLKILHAWSRLMVHQPLFMLDASYLINVGTSSLSDQAWYINLDPTWYQE